MIAYIDKPISEISTEDIRTFLKIVQKQYQKSSYSSFIKMLRRFFKDFLNREDLIRTFKFPIVNPEFKALPTKAELKRFYEALNHSVVKAMFLMWCTTGLRTAELINLKKENIKPELRMVSPRQHIGSSKLSWVTFYNEEEEKALNKCLQQDSQKVFGISNKTFKKVWKEAQEKTGLKISPKDLRAWFCDEMGSLGVPDRYIDAFCGRTPKTVLARHYSDYGWQKQKKRYEKAGLYVLS